MTKKLSILIIEDEPLIAADIEEACIENGHQISGIAYNYEEAIYYLNHKKVDFVLLDIHIDHQDIGLEIGQKLSAEYFIPFCYVTSFADNATLIKARNTRPVGYLIKPFRPKDITIQIGLGMDLHERTSTLQIPSLTLINNTAVNQISLREYDVIVAIFMGKSNLEIVEKLHISMNTVKTHLKNIFIKLNVKSRSELMSKLLT